MKIIKIRINPDSKIMTMDASNRKFVALILTVKKLWGREKEIKAFPCVYGFAVSDVSNKLDFLFFADELGKNFSKKISRQLSQFCFTLEITGLSNVQI